MRRTRISERMRKLQELVPNIDKVRQIDSSDKLTTIVCFVFGKLTTFFNYWQQTSIADMLDLAVEHIKDLQKQLKVLKIGEVNLDAHTHCHVISDTSSCVH